jgi:hypothetical protein
LANDSIADLIAVRLTPLRAAARPHGPPTPTTTDRPMALTEATESGERPTGGPLADELGAVVRAA